MSRGSQLPDRVVILGATSTIAEELARVLASGGAHIVLAGRNAERLEILSSDLRFRGAGLAVPWPLDLAAPEDASWEFVRMTAAVGGEVSAIVVIYGVLGDQRAAEIDAAELDTILNTNFRSAAQWCTAAAGLLERQKRGVLLAISSVAGDRGRQSNYAYGAAKAGLTVLMEGLAHRLAPTGARAVVVKLGFVDTAMTAHIKKGGPLWAKPDAIARQLAAILRRPGKPVVYLPWFWRPIMAVVRNIPVTVFHKTKL